MSSITIPILQLKNTDTPLVAETIISQTGFSTGVNTLPFQSLYNLNQALQALDPAPNSTTVQFTDTILLTDGVATNTLNKNGYTTKNSVQNSTHFLNFSDSSSTGIGAIQKTAGISCNPSSKTLSVSAFSNTTTLSPQSITQTEPLGTSTYIPTIILNGNSNLDVPITPLSNLHQVILQSAPIPIIDRLDPTPYTITVPEVFNTFSFDSGFMYIGCESGNVYYFNTSTETWNLQATFDGAVRCIYYHAPSGKIYIGGNFNNIIFPISQTGLNNICYTIGSPSNFNTIGVDTWTNYGTNGFDKEVNAIVGDTDNIYFGGKFQNIAGGGLNCNFIATYYWSSSGDLYALDNGSGNGFDNIVWGLSLSSSYLCVVGDFSNITTNSGSSSAISCCQLTIASPSFSISSIDFLYGLPNVLTNPISSTEKVSNDGSNFYISTNDNNINGSGINYFIGTGIGGGFSSPFQIGNNDATVQQQFTLQNGISSVGVNNIYLQGNSTVATIPFSSYLYWNSFSNRVEFIDLATGTIYAFIGSAQNRFTLQSGREIRAVGSIYTGGIVINQAGNGFGSNSILYWNGSYYSFISFNQGTLFN